MSDKKGGKKSAGTDEENTEEEEADGIPFEDKVVFAENVRKLQNDGLTKLVRFIKDNWPGALEDVDAEKLQIKIDCIDKENFEKAKELVEEFIASQQAAIAN